MEVRKYQPTDFQNCLQILRSNIPEYFCESDITDFSRFLNHLPGPFWVVIDPQVGLIACGGIALGETSDQEAVLCYGMVAHAYLRHGIGRVLLRKRLEVFLPCQPQVERITVSTTQKVEGFFRKFGFTVEERETDGFGPGLDYVKMTAPTEEVLLRLTEHE